MRTYYFDFDTYCYFLTVQFEDFCNEDGKYDLSMITHDIHKGQLTFQFKEGMDDDFKCTVIIG